LRSCMSDTTGSSSCQFDASLVVLAERGVERNQSPDTEPTHGVTEMS
jgi:hypothetical protein